MTMTTEDLTVAQVVPVTPEVAFRLYVNRPGRRHPGEGMSGAPGEIIYEPRAGGRWFEKGPDGREYDWGRVVEWDPPRRLVLSWMVNATSGEWAFDPDPDHASRVEITFEDLGRETRVQVRHTGFEAHGPGAESIRRGVGGGNGWSDDLADLRRAATESPTFSVQGVQVNLFCRDILNCREFYRRLGLDEVFRAPEGVTPEHIELEAAGVRIGLTSAEAATRIAGLALAPGAAIAAEVVFWSDDADAMYAAAVDAGGDAIAAPRESPDGRLRYGWVVDPEGHQVKLVQSL